MRKVFLFILVLINMKVFSQQPVYNGFKKFSSTEIKNDFNILTSAVKEYHPSCYRYITPDSLQSYIDKVPSSLNDSLTDNEFHVIVREFLVQIHCGHTVAMPSTEWYAYHKSNNKALPFDVIISGNKIFVRESFTDSSMLTAGTEVTAIDHTPADVIVDRMSSIHARDGLTESFVNYSIQRSFRTYYIFLYGSQPSYHITYRNRNNEVDSAVIEAASRKQKNQVVKMDTTLFTSTVKTSWSDLYISKSDPSFAFIDIKRFGSSKYKKFYKRVFKEIKSKNIDHLIIDVRDNGGGYFPNGNRLLRYLSDEKFAFTFDRPKHKPVKSEYVKVGFINRLTRSAFSMMIRDKTKHENIRSYSINYKPIKKNHYDGKIYLFTNGGSFSMSSYVASFLKYKTDAVLIGQESGGGEEGSNALISPVLTLPATKIRVSIPYYHLDHQIESSVKGRGVIPDIETNYTPEDVLQKRDKELEQILLMINK